MNQSWQQELAEELESLSAQDLLRCMQTVSTPQGREIFVDGKRVVNFCSNDYLGIAADPRIAKAAQEAIARYGWGSGASRLVCGNFEEHTRLEKMLAAFKKTEAALVFSSGYMANTGIIPALCRRGDMIFSDRLNHASIVDGILLSRAEWVRYKHNDPASLEQLLQAADKQSGRKLIVTDTVFSMDGDTARLTDIVDLAEKYNAWVMVDEAHAFGLLGQQGAGLVEALGLESRVHVQMGTLSKAAGGFGAYVTGPQKLIDFLVNKARSFIFTTGLPAAVAAAACKALIIIKEEPWRREKVLTEAQWLRSQLREAGFETGTSETAIIPVMLGESQKALQFSQALREQGFLVQAIRPPTVPPGTARLRVTVTAGHTKEDLQGLVSAFKKAPCI